MKHSKSEERENIKKSLSEASEWIYEQEMDTPLEVPTNHIPSNICILIRLSIFTLDI